MSNENNDVIASVVDNHEKELKLRNLKGNLKNKSMIQKLKIKFLLINYLMRLNSNQRNYV